MPAILAQNNKFGPGKSPFKSKQSDWLCFNGICFNLQGFSKDYKLPNICDSALYTLAGNAVSIPIIELIVNKLISII